MADKDPTKDDPPNEADNTTNQPIETSNNHNKQTNNQGEIVINPTELNNVQITKEDHNDTQNEESYNNVDNQSKRLPNENGVIDKTDSSNSNYANNIKYLASHGNLSLNDSKNEKEMPMLNNSSTIVRFSTLWRQTIATSASILLTFTTGLVSGFSAILLPQLQDKNSLIPGDASTASWIASMACLPTGVGCLTSGWLMERYGRRTSHFIICTPFIVSWIMIACAKNLTMMLIGRFLAGFCIGLLGPVSPVFIGETTDPKNRGFFLAALSLAVALGLFFAHLVGTFLSWQWTAVICSFFPALTVLLLFFIPESPTWLIKQKRVDDGIKSFGWLRGYSEEANSELQALIKKQKDEDDLPKLSWREKLEVLKCPEFYKPLFIMITFFCTCQFSGVNAVAFYSIDIVEKAVGSNFDHYVAMLSIDALRVVMSVVACVACRRFGRRPLTIISGIWTALSMVGLSMYLYFSEGKSVAHLSWIPLTCLLVYISAISLGLMPLPWMMCGEVFPTKLKGLGTGISSATTFTAFFIVVKTAPGMMKNLGEVVTFLTYGVVALIGTIIMYFVLPETKGKSLLEIEERFKTRSKD